MILPTLPKGEVSKNSVFLHADPAARPYRVFDFVAPLGAAVNKAEITGFGSYLFNHVWMITFRSDTEKEKLRLAGELKVKGRRCVIVDPNASEVNLKLHWLPTNVSDEAVRRAMTLYGKVTDVVREKWKLAGLEGIETTTRSVTLHLKEGVTTDSIPYQMKIMNVTVLVSVPGKPPLCLRCKQAGHIRSQCRAEFCRTCKGFGHTSEDCARSYAAMTKGALGKQNDDMIMDIQDTESAMQHERVPDGEVGRLGGAAETHNVGDNSIVAPKVDENPELTVREKGEMDWSQDDNPAGKRKGEDTDNASQETTQDQLRARSKSTQKKPRPGDTTATKVPLVEVGSSRLDDPDFF